MNHINLRETQDVAITVLIDNTADLLAKSSETVLRYWDEPLLAEHGFAALVDLRQAGIKILWDAGLTSDALLENMRRMKIDPATIDKIALSHGHWDHTAAITPALKAIVGPRSRKWDRDVTSQEISAWMQSQRVPLIAHPAVFRERWSINKHGAKRGPILPPSRAEWEAAGADLVLSESPYQLGSGCVTTGAVPRRSFEQAGTPPALAYRQGDEFIRDYVDDDQAILINVKDKGLVIVAGCAHSGIINTVNHAREISGVDRVWAILGGFHLAPANDEEIQRTIDAIQELRPAMIAPTHCTGLKAISEFARQMPGAFVQGAVGTRYLF
jgi:7,8-dihydropterin-6-yl-methyl-4-(beta-D-ribofuranosyl)aminobenzene 5'-phosphate synthase